MSMNAKKTAKAAAAGVAPTPAPRARPTKVIARASTATPEKDRPGQPGGKLGLAIDLMRRPEGATINQLSEATGWLPHSVRGAMSGALKKKHKLEISSEIAAAGRVYRIAGKAPR